MSEAHELIIIGGGAGGLAAAVYAGRADRDTLLIEKGSYGGRIKDTLEIRNYPGTIRDSGEGLMQKFLEHAKTYDTNTFTRTTVTGLDKTEDGFLVHTKRKGDFTAKSVILDVGTKPRMLGIEGETEFVGRGVAYCATCDAEFFKDKNVYVLGAGDQAVEEAGYLTRFASHVTIIVLHEEGHLDCNEMAARQAFKNPKISFVWNSTLEAVKGNGHVERLVIKNVVSGESREVSADGIFFFIGMVPQTELVRDMVDCDSHGYIKVNDMMETSIPGLYAIGDGTQKFLRQVITAAADGAIAETASERYVKEKEQLDEILNGDSGKVAFIFYNPYNTEEIGKVSELEEQWKADYHVFRQDVTRQDLLFKLLKLERTVAAAFYENGTLKETKLI